MRLFRFTRRRTIQHDDLFVRIETRDASGSRNGGHGSRLEIYRSGNDVNLMLSWCDQAERPMLWQGQHPVWMQETTACAARLQQTGNP